VCRRMSSLDTRPSRKTALPNTRQGSFCFSFSVGPSFLAILTSTVPSSTFTPHAQVTHKTPDIVPVFKYAAQPETRKRANLSYENKTIQNAPVLSEITRLRDEAAKLLGYKNHAEWVLEVRRGSVEHTGPFCRPLVRWNAR
jgi:hypothetical protein